MRRLICALFMYLAAGFYLSADEISFVSIVSLVLENDLTVRIARLSLDSSLHNRELLRAGTLPQITMNQAPGYAFSNSRYEDLLNDREITDLTTHGVSASVHLSQVLPTDGALSAGISDTMTVLTRGDETTIDQSPGLSLSVTQPVFTNGKVIDLSIYPARHALYGDLPVSRSSLQEKAAKNSGLMRAFSAYKAAFALRRQLLNHDANIGLTEKLLTLSRLRAKQGSITSREVWEEELILESMKEARLELKYTLLEAEQNLARSLGMTGALSGVTLAEAIPSIKIEESREQLIGRAISANPDVLDKIFAVEEARHTAVLNGRNFSADLLVSMSFTPKYSPARSNDDVGASFSDLFDEDAYIEPVVSVGLSIPVYDGGKAKHRREIDQNMVGIAEANLASARALVTEAARKLFLRRDMLIEKLELVRANLLYENERLAEKRRLFELKQVTALEVDRVQLKAREKEVEIWMTEADLFLNAVSILNQAGYDLQLLFEGST